MEDSYSDLGHLHFESGIRLDDDAISYLDEIRKWTMFFSILGFVAIGFMVIIGFGYSFIVSTLGAGLDYMPFPGYIIGFFYLFIGAIYFFPVLYLYKFSRNTKRALDTFEEEHMTIALSYLKSHYKILGVITVVMIILYFLAFLVLIPISLISGLL